MQSEQKVEIVPGERFPLDEKDVIVFLVLGRLDYFFVVTVDISGD